MTRFMKSKVQEPEGDTAFIAEILISLRSWLFLVSVSSGIRYNSLPKFPALKR